jgi:hypothetical protein
MSGAIFPLPQYASWSGAQLKAQGQLYLLPYLTCLDIHVESNENARQDKWLRRPRFVPDKR